MKTVCIYHSIDLDGRMSAAIVKHLFITKQGKNHLEYRYNLVTNNLEAIYKGAFETLKFDYPSITFIGYNYGQPIPDLSEYDEVIMVDISFPKEEMIKLFEKLDVNFIWIDHHISTIKDNGELDKYDIEDISTLYNGLRRTDFAACELTWKYFFPNEPMPEIVRLLGRYDCFGHKNTDEETKVLEFQYACRNRITNYNEAYDYLVDMLDRNRGIDPNDFRMIQLQKEGFTIYQYLCTEAKQVYKNGFEITLKENKYYRRADKFYLTDRKFICINRESFNLINFGIDYHKDGYDGCACFHYDGIRNVWTFSLYNDNGLVDCSLIAKQFGGGGHKGAAGFIVKDLNLIFKANE